MKRSVLARIDDMLRAIEHAEHILRSAEDADHLEIIASLALERAFEIISEASRYLTPDMKADHLQIDWRLIAGIGNILRHDYDRIETDILVGVTKNDLPALRTVLLALRSSLEG